MLLLLLLMLPTLLKHSQIFHMLQVTLYVILYDTGLVIDISQVYYLNSLLLVLLLRVSKNTMYQFKKKHYRQKLCYLYLPDIAF